MKCIELDLTDLRLLSEAILSTLPEQHVEAGMLETLDPLLEKLLTQAQSQIEEPLYHLHLEEAEVVRLRDVLACALDQVAEEGDIMLMGHLGELLSRLD